MSWWDEFKSAMGHWFLHDNAAKAGVTLTHAPNPPQSLGSAGDASSQPLPPNPPQTQPKEAKALPATGQSTVPQGGQPTQGSDPYGGLGKLASGLGSLFSSGAKAYKDLGLGSKSGSDKKLINPSDQSDEDSGDANESEEYADNNGSADSASDYIDDSSDVVD